MRVEYTSNNSGGDWWLTDDNWKALEAAGWKVDWFKGKNIGLFFEPGKDGRWLGALAKSASREGLTLGEAIAEWERITGLDSAALGCSCCGAPHLFTTYNDNGTYLESYSPDFPTSGSRYGEED